MFTQHIALVPESDEVNEAEVARVSAALQKQVARDFAPHWGIIASVDFFRRIEDVPFDYWPVVVGRGSERGAPRIRIEATGQPFAYVALERGWTVRASQACLEMLVNPQGTHTVGVTSPRDTQSSIALLVEVCAPCAGLRNAYMINGVLVSDFCTPSYFTGPPAQRNQAYSATGAINAPLQVRPGGHLTWYDFNSGSWWLRNHWGDCAADTELGPHAQGSVAIREWVRRIAPEPLATSPEDEALQLGARVVLRRALSVSRQRASRLRALLADNNEARGAQTSERPPSASASSAAPRERGRASSYAEEPEVIALVVDDAQSYDTPPRLRTRTLRTHGEVKTPRVEAEAPEHEMRAGAPRVVLNATAQDGTLLRRGVLLTLMAVGGGLASFGLGHLSEQLFVRHSASAEPIAASADASLQGAGVDPPVAVATPIGPPPAPVLDSHTTSAASARAVPRQRKASAGRSASTDTPEGAAAANDPVEDLIQTRE